MDNEENTIILTTYNDDETEREFEIKKGTLNKLIKAQDWRDMKDFLSNYIYDNSFDIYNCAKDAGEIISEKLVPSLF